MTFRRFFHRLPNVIQAVVPILALSAMAATPLPDLDIRLKGAWPPYGPATAEAIVAHGHHAYIAAGEAGLLVFDVSTPAQPKFVAALSLPGFTASLAILGDHLVVANEGDSSFRGLYVFSVSDPVRPREVARVPMAGSPVDVAVSGTRAVVLNRGYWSDSGQLGDGVEIVDLEIPEQPRRLGRIDAEAGMSAASLAASNGIACFLEWRQGSRTNHLSFIDLTPEQGPHRVSQYPIVNAADEFLREQVVVGLNGGYAFLRVGTSLRVVALRNPARPVLASEAYVEGSSRAGVFFAGKYAYFGSTILDVTDPRHPAEVGWLEGMAWPGGWSASGARSAWMAAVGDRLLRIGGVTGFWDVPNVDVLRVIDVSNPKNSRTLTSFAIESNARTVALSGSLAFVANGRAGLQIVDVSNPEKPDRVADFLEFGPVRSVTTAGTNAFLSGSGGYTVLDISDPRHPRICGSWADVHGALTVSGDRGFLFREGDTRVLEILDLSDLDKPRSLTRLEMSNFTALLPVSTQFQYLPDPAEGWVIHDVSDPQTPVRIGSYRAMIEAMGGVLAGNLVHTSYGVVYDVSDPARPRDVGDAFPTVQARSGHLGCQADGEYGLQCYDVSDPMVPRLIGRFFGFPGGRALGVALSGTDAFVAAGAAGLQIVDLSRPSVLKRGPATRPAWLGGGFPSEWTPAGDYSLATHPYGSTLRVFNLSDHRLPEYLSVYVARSRTADVTASGRFAYIAEGGIDHGPNPVGGRLAVVDLGDPAQPREVGALELDGPALGVVVAGATALVAAGAGGLVVVDVSDPVRPVEAGRFDTRGMANDVALAGPYAIVADGWAGLQVMDFSQPSQLRQVGEFRGISAERIQVTGSRACVWSGSSLLLFDLSDPVNPRLISRIMYSINDQGGQASVFGDYVVILNGSGLEILDIKDPAHPRRVAGNSAINPWGSLGGLLDGTLVLREGDNEVFTIPVPPFFRSMLPAEDGLQLEWEGWGRARLQRASRPDATSWQEVPGSESVSRLDLLPGEPTEFFRLVER